MIEFQKLFSFFFPFIEVDFRYVGNFYYDLHIHTTASDSFIKPEFFKSFLNKKRYLFSITDHNDIRGAIRVRELGVNNVPGIEIGCKDGFEMLIYFKKIEDLEEFYRKEVEPYKNLKRMAKTYRSIYEYLNILDQWECHKSIPHICGMAQKKFINNKEYIYDILKKVDSLETYNHGLPSVRNLSARELRKKYGLCATFGSDAHILREVISFYKYSNMDLARNEKIIDYLYKIGSLSGIGQKHFFYMIKSLI